MESFYQVFGASAFIRISGFCHTFTVFSDANQEQILMLLDSFRFITTYNFERLATHIWNEKAVLWG